MDNKQTRQRSCAHTHTKGNRQPNNKMRAHRRIELWIWTQIGSSLTFQASKPTKDTELGARRWWRWKDGVSFDTLVTCEKMRLFHHRHRRHKSTKQIAKQTNVCRKFVFIFKWTFQFSNSMECVSNDQRIRGHKRIIAMNFSAISVPTSDNAQMELRWICERKSCIEWISGEKLSAFRIQVHCSIHAWNSIFFCLHSCSRWLYTMKQRIFICLWNCKVSQTHTQHTRDPFRRMRFTRKRWNQNVNIFIVMERAAFSLCARGWVQFSPLICMVAIKLQTLIYLLGSRMMHANPAHTPTQRRSEWMEKYHRKCGTCLHFGARNPKSRWCRTNVEYITRRDYIFLYFIFTFFFCHRLSLTCSLALWFRISFRFIFFFSFFGIRVTCGTGCYFDMVELLLSARREKKIALTKYVCVFGLIKTFTRRYIRLERGPLKFFFFNISKKKYYSSIRDNSQIGHAGRPHFWFEKIHSLPNESAFRILKLKFLETMAIWKFSGLRFVFGKKITFKGKMETFSNPKRDYKAWVNFKSFRIGEHIWKGQQISGITFFLFHPNIRVYYVLCMWWRCLWEGMIAFLWFVWRVTDMCYRHHYYYYYCDLWYIISHLVGAFLFFISQNITTYKIEMVEVEVKSCN